MSTDRIISVESGGDRFAKNPRSTAYGPGQFIRSTWIEMLARHRPDLIAGKSEQELLSLRSDPDLSRAMTDAYAGENNARLERHGLPVRPGTTYLSHFAGPDGAVAVLKADPSASAGTILGPDVIKANPFLANMTAGDLIAWADTKMGGGAPSAPAAAPAGILAAPAAQSAPDASAQGLLAGLTQQPPSLAEGASPGLLAELEQLRAAQAQAQEPAGPSLADGAQQPMRRRPVDLSRLQAMRPQPRRLGAWG